jgi:hypothetical protein
MRVARRASVLFVGLATVCGLAALSLTACTADPPPTFTGTIAPIVDAPSRTWTAEAWALGPDVPALLGTATAKADGTFSLGIDVPAGVVLVEAHASDQPDSPTLSALVKDMAAVDGITLNERTTVAAGYALAGFYSADGPSGPAPGLPNAAAMAENLADPVTGDYGDVLTSAPNGSETSTLDAFTSLANMLGACLLGQEACDEFYQAVTVDRVTAPYGHRRVRRDRAGPVRGGGDPLHTLDPRGRGSPRTHRGARRLDSRPPLRR